MQVELDNRLDNQNKDALFGVLLEANNFEVPQESIDNEAQSLKAGRIKQNTNIILLTIQRYADIRVFFNDGKYYIGQTKQTR
jgi:FKBP-type peptidyl-prolyl cis-trans isomerase (trigger factor)